MIKQILSILSAVAFCAAASPLVLNGDHPYAIHLSKDASPCELTAARELQHYLREMGHADFPIVPEIPDGYRGIFLGHSQEVSNLLPDINLEQLSPDEIIIQTLGDNLVLTGETKRGTLYAVYTFLEDYLGVRWWTSQAEYVPQPEKLQVPSVNCRYVPPFFNREVYYDDVIKHYEFAARLKINGHNENIPPEYGDHNKILGWVHTFWRLLPSEKYFEDHPEWFSLVNGLRIPGTPGSGQLCLTNPEMRDELVANAAQWLRDEPGRRIISVSQNDVWGQACECPVCSSLAEQVGQSGVLIDFVNYVAAELEKEFPDVLVDTLAYYHTVEPPKSICPQHNVIVRFAPITSDFGRPLDGSGDNNTNIGFARMLQEWSQISPQLAVWNYVQNFSNDLLPHPNFRNIANDLRFFADNHVVSVLEQGGPSENELSNFCAMRIWVMAKLLWNPQLDQDKLLEEFARGYYGPAADKVLGLFKMIHEEHYKNGGILRCNLRGTALSLDKCREGQDIMAQAIAENAGDPELVRRLRAIKAHFDFAWLDSVSPVQLTEEEREAGKKLVDELQELVDFYHADFYGESHNFAEYMNKLRTNLDVIPDFKTAAIPEFCRERPQDRWFEYGTESFRLTLPGNLTDIIGEPASASGKVSRLYASTNWLLQLQIPRGSWQVMISMRMKAKETVANDFATEIGVFNEAMGKNEYCRNVGINAFCSDEFQWYDFGKVDIVSGYLYFSVFGNPALEYIDVERIVLLPVL